MKLKHHVIRKFNDSKNAPLWKKIVAITLVITVPLLFSLARMLPLQQTLGNNQQPTATHTPK
jgi:hypothetical protein